jgi:endonuclease III
MPARSAARPAISRPDRKPKAEPIAPRVTRARAAKILDLLERAHPEATCALHYKNAFELVIATILSAQCTDERVNQVTPELFRRFPDAAAMAAAPGGQLESLIRPTGFFRAKTRSILGCAKALQETHGGQVPRRLDDLVKLPGIGRKTANVVLGHAYDIAEGIAVDTHVVRVANRLGLVESTDPIVIEAQLMKVIPQERWTRTTDLLIFHGRKICQARRPDCGKCPVFALCRWEHRQAFAMGEPPRAREAARAARKRRAS